MKNSDTSERVPATYRADVEAALVFSRRWQDEPLPALAARARNIKRAWEDRVSARWEQHRARVVRSEESPDAWDPLAGAWTRDELRELFALVREATWRRLRLRHYDVQMAAGFALVDGSIVDMKTGEGKTIVILFPAVAHGLLARVVWEVTAGSSPMAPRASVHVMTANDYLARRDALELRPVYEVFGLSVDVLQLPFDPLGRYLAYQCDVVYGTVNEFGFDYLRDQNVLRGRDRKQSLLHVAILDEVDHILVDEGTTPLILSEADDDADSRRRTVHLFHNLRQLVETPQVYGRADDGVLRFTPLGAHALSLAVRDFLEGDGPARPPAGEALARFAARLCADVLAQGDAAVHDGLVERAGDRMRLTERGRDELGKALAVVTDGDHPGGWWSDILPIIKQFRELLKETEFIMRSVGITPEEVRVIRRFARAYLLRSLRVSPRALGAAAADFVEGLVEGVVAAMAEDGAALAAHLRLMVRVGVRAGLLDAADAGVRALVALVGGLATQPGDDEALRGIGADLERFWLEPGARGLGAVLERFPPDYRVAIRACLRILMGAFARGHRDPLYARRLGGFFHSVQGAVFVPTFFLVFEEARHVVLQPLAEVLLRNFVREALVRDLWPGRAPLPGESLNDAVTRLLPEAESVTRTCLIAYLFRQANVDYIVRGNQVELVSTYTGFREEGRRYSGLLHLFVEAKEGLPLQESRHTSGRIAVQGFLRQYRCMVGLSATALLAQDEFMEVYGIPVVAISPNCSRLHVLSTRRDQTLPRAALPTETDDPGALVYLTSANDLPRAFQALATALDTGEWACCFTRDPALLDELQQSLRASGVRGRTWRWSGSNQLSLPDQVYRTQREKHNQAADFVAALHARRQPVLIAAPDIRAADQFAEVLAERAPHLPVTRLDARPQHAEGEAEVIARAGEPGRVTLATQMAGRGVDILVQPGTVESGGLCVVGLERRDSRRWDMQVAGRTARQGDLGYHVFYTSLQDPLMERLGGARIGRQMEWLGAEENEVISHPWIDRSLAGAQRHLEAVRRSERVLTVRHDEQLAELRAELYAMRERTMRSTHPCPGVHAGTDVPELPLSSNETACAECVRGRGDPGPLRRGVWPMRADVRQVLLYVLEDSVSGGRFDEYLVDRYAPEHTWPEDWDWKGLARELSAFLRRRVRRRELARMPSMAERVLRVRNRNRYVPRAVYALVRRAVPAEAGRYVNPANRETPWVERRVLLARIATLVERQELDALGRRMAAEFQGDSFPTDAVYFALYRRLQVYPGTIHAFRAQVRDAESLRAYLVRTLSDTGAVAAPLSSVWARRRTVARRLSPLLGPFGVRQEDIESQVAVQGPEGSAADAAALRRFCLERVEARYAEWLERLGKGTLYRLENQALRSAIDTHFQRLLDHWELHTQGGRHLHLEDSVRDTQLQIREVCRRTRQDIAVEFITTLGRLVRARLGDMGGPTAAAPAQGGVGDGTAACICDSGAELRACCGSFLYEGA